MAATDDVLAALRGFGPMTADQVARVTGLTVSSANRALGKLRYGEPRRVRVSGWLKTAGNTARIYAAGRLPDAPRPPRDSAARRTERHRQKLQRAAELRAQWRKEIE